MTYTYIIVEEGQTATVPNWAEGGSRVIHSGVWMIGKKGDLVYQISRIA